MKVKIQKGGTTDLKDLFNSAATNAEDNSQTDSKTRSPFSLRLTAEEKAILKEQAGGRPLGSYIRSRLLGDKVQKRRKTRMPSTDHQKLALVLSELGKSRLASNMNQLAKAANIGVIDTSDGVIADLEDACRSISQMREILIVALGLKPESDQ